LGLRTRETDRLARTGNSTRYAISAPEIVEYLGSWVRAASGDVFEALPDRLAHIGPGGSIEKTLVGFGILNDGLRFAFYG